MNRELPHIILRFPGLPVRAIGPGDDVVVSAEALAVWIDQYAYEYASAQVAAERKEIKELFEVLGMQPGASAGSAIGILIRNDFGEEFDFQLDREAYKRLTDRLRGKELSSHKEEGGI